MKIRITGHGLKKAQYYNSQIGTSSSAPIDINHEDMYSYDQSYNNSIQMKKNRSLLDKQRAATLNGGNEATDVTNMYYDKPFKIGNTKAPGIVSDYTDSVEDPDADKIQPMTAEEQWRFLNPNNSPKEWTGPLGSFDNKMSLDDLKKEYKEYSIQKPQPKKQNNGVGMGVYWGLEAAGGVGNMLTQPGKQAAWDKQFRQESLTDNSQPLITQNQSGNRGDYDINSGMFRPNETGFKSKGMYTNKFYSPESGLNTAQYGGALNELLSMSSNTPTTNIYEMFNPSSYAPLPSSDVTFNGTGPVNNSSYSKTTTALEHNNPGNIHIEGGFAKKYGAVSGRPDVGGHVAIFPDMATGFKAMEDLIFSPSYNNLTITQARKRWVGHTGWEDSARDMVHAVGGDFKLKDLSPDQKDIFLGKVTKWENIPQYYKELKKMGLLKHKEGGNVNENNMKIRITGDPEYMAYGGQKGYGIDLGQSNTYSKMNQSSFSNASNTIKEVPRDQANIEAERGETVYGDLNGDGVKELKNVPGDRHFNGGTPLNVREGSFIFSDTKKMKIKDPEILKYFGKTSAPKGGITPADISKQYNITKYKAILQDPLSDPIAKRTAEMMLTNMNAKLSKLADVQEGMKGFPQGRPKVSTDQEQQGLGQAAYGGYLRQYQGSKGSSTVGPNFSTYQSDVNSRLEDAQKAGYDLTKPSTFESTIPQMQHSVKGASGVYGTQNYWDEAHQKELKANFPDYFNTHPNFNPTKDTGDLQHWYDKQEEAVGVPADKRYFRGTAGKGNPYGFDGLLGGHTGNMPLLNKDKYTPTPPPPKKIPDTPPGNIPGDTPHPGDIPSYKDTTRSQWWLQDKNNAMNAAVNYANIKKYLPYIPDVSLQTSDPTFEDWRGQAGALQSGYQNDARMMGVYGAGTALGSNISSVAGKQAEQLAGVISGVNQRNAGTANQFAERNAALMNSEGAQRAQNRAEMWKGNVIANQQYDNAKKENKDYFVNAMNQGFTNAANTYNENSVNPHFAINPGTGGHLYFKGATAKANFMNQMYGQNGNDNYLDQYHNEFQKALKMFNDTPNDKGLRDELIKQHLSNWSKMNTESKRATTNAMNMPKGYTTSQKVFTGTNQEN